MEQSQTPTPYAVLCPKHGRIYMTEREYLRQLNRPDSRWECPTFDDDPKMPGLCGMPSNFDDATFEDSIL